MLFRWSALMTAQKVEGKASRVIALKGGLNAPP